MNAVLAGIDEGEAVMPRIDVEEIGLERFQDVVGRLEVEDLGIERHHVVEPLRGEHGMAHAERPGAEAGNGTAGLERIARNFGAMERFEPVADRIGKNDQILDAAFFGERTRTACDLDAVFLQTRGKRVERRGIGDFPAVERRPLVRVAMDDDALLAVVHAQRERAAALVDNLHAEKARAVIRPIVEILGADADIAERVEIHRCSPAGVISYWT